MKKILTSLLPVLTLALVSQVAWAGKATLKVKDLDTDEDGETSIVIKKGATAATPSPVPPQWEIVQDTQEIEGDAAAGSQEAQANWKSACADWKKEFKEMNKENKILVMDCGKATSALQPNGQRVYSSTAHYKMKTRTDSAPDQPRPTVTVTAAPATPAPVAATPAPAPATPAPAPTNP